MKPVAFLAAEVGAVAAASIGVALSEVTVPENVAVGGAVGLMIIAGRELVSWYLRVKADRDKSKTERVEVDQTAEDRKAARQRKADRDAWVELQQVMAGMKADREMDREEIHRCRDAIQTEKMARAVADARLADCERHRAELDKRVEALEKRA